MSILYTNARTYIYTYIHVYTDIDREIETAIAADIGSGGNTDTDSIYRSIDLETTIDIHAAHEPGPMTC